MCSQHILLIVWLFDSISDASLFRRRLGRALGRGRGQHAARRRARVAARRRRVLPRAALLGGRDGRVRQWDGRDRGANEWAAARAYGAHVGAARAEEEKSADGRGERLVVGISGWRGRR